MRPLIPIAILALGLTACSTPASQRDTYALIKAEIRDEINKQAQSQAQAQAQAQAVSSALLPPLAVPLPQVQAPQEERFSVAFNNIPAQQFFASIVSGTRYNMLVHPDVAGNISANLKDVTLFEALDAIREVYGYDYKVVGKRISIRPLTVQTRIFQVNYLSGNRSGSSDIRVSSGSVGDSQSNGSGGSSGGGSNNSSSNNSSGSGNSSNSSRSSDSSIGRSRDSSRISTASSSDFWMELKAALETIVGSKDGNSIVISPQSGVVVVRAMPDDLRSVEQYLKAAQISVDRQVILEAKILEVQLNDSTQTGINWASFASFRSGHTNRVATGFVAPGTTLAPLPFAGGQPPVQVTTGPSSITASTGFALGAAGTAAGSLFGLAFQTANFSALITFLESQGTVHVLSSPRIATLNNQKAVLKIGTDEFFVTGVSTTTTTATTGSGTVSPNVTLQPFFSGVVLDVTPQIDDQGNIILHVHPQVSQVSTVTKLIDLGTGGSLSLPLASSTTSETDSVVRGRDGRIVAIGGLMRQSATGDRSQVPGIGDVPGIGALFRNTSQVTQKRELVILIKSTIVKDDDNTVTNEELQDSVRRIEQLAPPKRGQRN
jgi:MSHA biogenesis protein MshL